MSVNVIVGVYQVYTSIYSIYIPSNLNNPNQNFHLSSFCILYSENRKPLGLFPQRRLKTITLIYNYIYLFK